MACRWPICGPKLSLCYLVISVWGFVQFLLLGIFFIVEAVPLIDDFDLTSKNISDPTIFDNDLKEAFHQRAFNCWIAAGLYVALLVFTGIQFRIHIQKSSTPTAPPTVTSPFVGVTTETNGRGQQYGIQFSNDQGDT